MPKNQQMNYSIDLLDAEKIMSNKTILLNLDNNTLVITEDEYDKPSACDKGWYVEIDNLDSDSFWTDSKCVKQIVFFNPYAKCLSVDWPTKESEDVSKIAVTIPDQCITHAGPLYVVLKGTNSDGVVRRTNTMAVPVEIASTIGEDDEDLDLADLINISNSIKEYVNTFSDSIDDTLTNALNSLLLDKETSLLEVCEVYPVRDDNNEVISCVVSFGMLDDVVVRVPQVDDTGNYTYDDEGNLQYDDYLFDHLKNRITVEDERVCLYTTEDKVDDKTWEPYLILSKTISTNTTNIETTGEKLNISATGGIAFNGGDIELNGENVNVYSSGKVIFHPAKNSNSGGDIDLTNVKITGVVNFTGKDASDQSTAKIMFAGTMVDFSGATVTGLNADGTTSSEASSAPYIVASGTYDFWAWRAWSDGTAECWGKTSTATFDCTHEWFGNYVDVSGDTWAHCNFFPGYDDEDHVAQFGSFSFTVPGKSGTVSQLFSEAPILCFAQFNIEASDNTSDPSWIWLAQRYPASCFKTPYYLVVSPKSGQVTGSYSYYCKGKWKIDEV